MLIKKLQYAAAAFASVAVLTVGSALAHTSYLEPNIFATTKGKMVTIEASFTEDFPHPDFVVKSEDWHYYTPKGERKPYDLIQEFKQVTILEQAIEENGTYRFSTGERLGREGTVFKLKDGTYKSAFTPEGKQPAVPEGAVILTSQTATIADVYVTKGAPTTPAMQTSIGRLQIVPVTHPNEIYLDDGFAFRLLFDGKPLQDQAMKLYRAGGKYAADKGVMDLKSGTSTTKITFEHPGVYLLMSRHKTDAPTGSKTDIRSYSTSLTFEVTP